VSDPAALAPIVAAIASAFVVAGVGVIEGREILSVQRTPPDPVRRITRGPGRRATRARKHIVERETPQLLDLLAAGSTAGLSAELSFRRSELTRLTESHWIRDIAAGTAQVARTDRSDRAPT